jgi:perosamine synthetase
VTLLANSIDVVPEVVSAIRQAIGDAPVALHEPRFAGNEWAYVKECIDSNFVSSVGKFVTRFEHDLAEFTGARYAVAVANGTAALQVAFQLAGVKPGYEVLVPALTFVGTVNPVVHCGGIPHFIDSEERTLGIDPAALREYLGSISEHSGGQLINRRTGRVIHAVVPMHAFGHPLDIDGVLGVARDFGLVIVEDAAESLGSYYHGRHTGTFGRVNTLSFNGNKTITTGGGGAILTDDAELAAAAKHLTTTAKVPHVWEYRHDRVAYNYRMPNLNAALGCAQLEQLHELLAAQRRLYEQYRTVFARVAGVRLMAEPEGCRSNYWLQALILETGGAETRDAILSATNAAGITTRPIWTLMHRLPHFADCPRMPLPVAESLEERVVNIPSSACLADDGASASTP